MDLSPRFDPGVLAPDPERRAQVLGWLEAALAAVEPEKLSGDALAGHTGPGVVIVAIGKAAPAMSRGAAAMIDVVGGICVTDHVEPVPEQLTLIVGDHPIPGAASLEAGRAVLEIVRSTPPATPIIALLSGGGSALCEAPRDGVPPGYLSEVTRRLVAGGAAIQDINLVRAHLSAIKGGGVAFAAGRPIDTYLISDVAGADPGVVASGPTIPRPPEPQQALTVLGSLEIEVPGSVRRAMTMEPPEIPLPHVVRLADGRDAGRAVTATAGPEATLREEWLGGDLTGCLEEFLDSASHGVTVGVGEVVLDVRGPGRGGRNTHAALLAADRLAGSDALFCAFATDGIDGRSGSAGAVVDGSTVVRGGDITVARERYDSASYLAATSDLLLCGPTGTNVSDIWILWRSR